MNKDLLLAHQKGSMTIRHTTIRHKKTTIRHQLKMATIRHQNSIFKKQEKTTIRQRNLIFKNLEKMEFWGRFGEAYSFQIFNRMTIPTSAKNCNKILILRNIFSSPFKSLSTDSIGRRCLKILNYLSPMLFFFHLVDKKRQFRMPISKFQ